MEQREYSRYNRQMILPEVGTVGQKKLKAAKVLVVGAGGLGCPVLQYLAAAGVGTIGIIDHDTVDESNLHRQILYNSTDIGNNKATTAAEKLRLQNPYITTQPYPVKLTATNAAEIINNYDLVIDGSDNFTTRYLVNDTCVALDKPLVFGSIQGFESQVSVFNYQDGPTYRCIFPEPGEAPNCAVNGVLGILPGIAGTLMANEALKLILGIGEVLSGKLLVLDALSNSQQIFQFARVWPVSEKAKFESKKGLGQAGVYNTEDTLLRVVEQEEILPADFKRLIEEDMGGVFLVDVREPHEHQQHNIGGINIPISKLPGQLNSLPEDKKIIFYCHVGVRSLVAVEMARDMEDRDLDVLSLKYGVAGL